MDRRFSKLAIQIAIGFSIVSVCIAALDTWSRGIRQGVPGRFDTSSAALSMAGVSKGIDAHLWGFCTYCNYSSTLRAIEGVEGKDGNFHPTIVSQVSNKTDGKWKTIRSAAVPGKPATVTVPPKSRSQMFYVNMDAFVPLIGKFEYGRVLLKTGEKVELELTELHPPE